MNLFSGLKEISSNDNYFIYKAIRESDSLPVILKTIKDKSKRKNLKERLQNEKEITTQIGKPWTNRVIDFIEEPDCMLVFRDGDEVSLRQYLNEKNENNLDFLPMGLSITKKLIEIHEAKIIHRDIKPSNILYDKYNNDFFFIDFGLSKKFSRNFQEDNRSLLEGTPEFISPESTGRTGNTEDFRSDLYSLGITFYEILTGKLPFPYSDPLKLIHAHLAIPARFDDSNSNIFPILKRIVLKLLEKSPTSRYQSAVGLFNDLKKIEDTAPGDRFTLDFKLGEEDTSHEFIIPKKLYGREGEISQLLKNFEEIKNVGNRTTLIGGHSGIGKSALINMLQVPILEEKGFFISGKYEQYKKNIPFSAILGALKTYLRLLILENDDIIKQIKGRILKSLGEIGAVITGLIPEYTVLLGEQPALPELPPSQESNRFQLGLERLFLGITAEKPIVFFLDDLQWVDAASLGVLRSLLSMADLKNIYFLLAYRDNEVDDTHPFMKMIADLEKENWSAEKINIQPLPVNTVNELISDTLRRDPSETLELSSVLHARTHGNPFFLHQILYAIYDRGGFKLQNNCYLYSIDTISEMGAEDSVVDLMLSRISKLPPRSCDLLSAASCMGSIIEFKVLSKVLQDEDLSGNLYPILEEGFFTRTKYIRESEEIIEFRFSHDRIQQAAYQRWDEKKKEVIHYKMGFTYLEDVRKGGEKLFEFLEQWNSAVNLLSGEERKELFYFNMEGAKRAKSSAAYMGSLQILKKSFELLEWLSPERELLLELYLERGEVECLNFNYDVGESYFLEALNLCESRLERLKVYEKRVYFLFVKGEYDRSIEVGIEIIREFNEKINYKFKKIDLFNLIKELQEKLKIFDLNEIEFKKNSNIDIIYYFKINNLLLSSSYYSNVKNMKEYISIIIQIEFIHYGIILNSIIVLVYIAISLHQFQYHEFSKKIIFYIHSKYSEDYSAIHFLNTAILHNYYNLNYNYLSELKAFEYFYSNGEKNMIGSSQFTFINNIFLKGMNLIEIIDYLNYFVKINEKQKLIKFIEILKEYYNLIYKLIYNKEYSNTTEDNQIASSINFYKILFSSYRNDIEVDNSIFNKVSYFKDNIKYSYLETEFDFYHCLILLRSSRQSEEIYSQNEKKIMSFVSLFEEKASLCPENNLHKLLLIQAELARTKKDYWNAIELYDRAIASAREFEFLNNSTLSLERASIFYEEIGKPLIAETYLLEAIRENEKWGATGRAEELKKKIRTKKIQSPIQDPAPSHSSQTTSLYNIDTLTIIKASRVLAEERNITQLLEKFLGMILENSGAEWAMYLELNSETWKPILTTGKELTTEIEFPGTLLRYIENMKEPIVLSDATADREYGGDVYFRNKIIKSVLVLPVLHKGQLLGSVYMENNLSGGVFTGERVDILSLLGATAAVFIENARSFQIVEELTHELKRQNEILEEQKERATRAYFELEVSQRQLIQADKMITLGTMVAGVAHEINTPLGAIKASGENIKISTHDLIDSKLFINSNLNDEDRALVKETLKFSLGSNKTYSSRELRQMKKSLKEKLSTFSEIDTERVSEDLLELGLYESPENYNKILYNPHREELLKITLYYFGILKKSSVVQISAERVSKIVKSLKSYIHFDNSDEMQLSNLSETMETILTILHSKLKNGIEVTTHYEELPPIYCYADELGQIFTNLIHNSIQAMEGKGNLNIDIKYIAIPDKETIISPFPPAKEDLKEFLEKYHFTKFVSISIEDSGPGIPAEIQKKIFEPFFTTKKAGEGSGLGLHIIRKILDKHAGYLELFTVPGCTRFTVKIPARVRFLE